MPPPTRNETLAARNWPRRSPSSSSGERVSRRAREQGWLPSASEVETGHPKDGCLGSYETTPCTALADFPHSFPEQLMTTLSLPISPSPLVDRWQNQIGRRQRLGLTETRPLAALDFAVHGGADGTLVPVERLVIRLLYDAPDGDGLRFAAYGTRRIPWGVALGGIESHRLERNAALEPLAWARRERLDASDGWLLRQVLRMDRRIERHQRSGKVIDRTRPALPSFWAAFPRDVASRIDGDGPELTGLVHESGRSTGELLAEARREYRGRVLFPLAWVSHHWESAAEVYADLRGLAWRQLFRLGTPAESLVGFRGACQFDFVSNRFATLNALAG